MKITVAGNAPQEFKDKLLARMTREAHILNMARANAAVQARVESEEMAAECVALGRNIADIVVHDDRDGFNHAPASHRFQATWGEPDLDCLHGDGPTPQAAMWDLIDATDVKP
jgi:hypothetical protein